MKKRPFQSRCEGGTYIRKLCYDIGEILGVWRSHAGVAKKRVQVLRRKKRRHSTLHDVLTGFQNGNSKDPKILHKFIQPMEKALALMPKIVIRDSAVDAYAMEPT